MDKGKRDVNFNVNANTKVKPPKSIERFIFYVVLFDWVSLLCVYVGLLFCQNFGVNEPLPFQILNNDPGQILTRYQLQQFSD
jgi:hypothetical protein